MSAPTAVPPGEPEFYEAVRATDGSDAVNRGARLTAAEAILARQAGDDIVVCGPDTIRNDRAARTIEEAATPANHPAPIHHGPHGGPLSLPHWQQKTPPPAGHSFHETPRRQARIVS
jgi:hypothetical protein